MFTKIQILLICGLLYATSLFPQQAKGFINQLPDYPNITTPMAMSFQKYIDHPINLYNGTPDIAIPLLDLKDGDISLPITLRYNSSGIRANEEASWVGLGWNLNVGGMITQSVVGECDDNDTEFAHLADYLDLSNKKLYNHYDGIIYTEAMQRNLWGYFGNPAQLYQSGKMNPDVFYFSYPGGSGKFIIDYRDNSIHQLDRSESIKIRLIQPDNSQPTGDRKFEITTTEGIVHTFTELVKTYPNDLIGRPLSISYALTSSLYPNGQKVTYNYYTTPIKTVRKSYVFQAPFESTGESRYLGDKYYQDSETEINGREFYLTSINTPHYRVSFILDSRDDTWGGLQLSSIRVSPTSDASNIIKDIRFEYGYFESEELPGRSNLQISGWKSGYNTKRLKLMSVFNQKGAQKDNCHMFFYNDVVPNKYTYNIDYWGYYNGTAGYRRNTYLPDLSEMKWGVFLSPGLRTNTPNILQDYNFSNYSNRSYSFSDCKAGILQGIQYPTGGYVAYEYEPNSFIDLKLPDKTSETIEREDWNRPSDSGIIKFVLPKDCNVEIEGRINRGLNTWEEIWRAGGACSVTLLRGYSSPTTPIYSHLFSDECLYQANHDPASSEIVVKTTLALPAKSSSGQSYTYFIAAGFPDALGLQYGADTKHGSTRIQATYKLDTYINGEIQGCGVRVKSIKTYNKKGDQVPLTSTSYEYKNPANQTCSGILHDQVQFVKPYYGLYNCLKDLTAPEEMPVLVQENTMEVSSESPISNPYASAGGVGYSYVTETKDKSSLTAGHTVYQYANEAPDFALGSAQVDHPLDGKLLSVKNYTKEDKLIKSEEYTYRTNTTHFYWGINILDNINMFPGIYASSSQLVTQVPYDDEYRFFPGRLRIIAHQLNACDVTLSRKTVMQDGVKTNEEYVYDPSTLQLLKRTIRTSDTDSLSYTYAYPNHFNFAPYTDMTLKNMIKPAVESRLLKDGNMKKGLLTQYSLYPASGGIYPSSRSEVQIAGNIGDPLSLTPSGANISIYPYTNTTWDKYDNQGNPLAVTVGNLKTVYLWAYNSLYPVVKIEGATYEEVEGWLSASTISNLSTNTTTVSTVLDSIRNMLSEKGVLVTTYTYQPLVGITSMTAPNGEVTTYEYDSFNRLSRVKDHDGKVVNQYDYYYKP